MITSKFGVELAGEGLLALLDLAEGLAFAEDLFCNHRLAVDLVESVQDYVSDVLGVALFCLEEVGLSWGFSFSVEFLPNGFFALLPHLLTHKTTHHLEQCPVLHSSLHDDVTLPDLILEISITDVLDMQTHDSLLLEAPPQMIQKVISPKVNKMPTVQFILDGDVIVI